METFFILPLAELADRSFQSSGTSLLNTEATVLRFKPGAGRAIVLEFRRR